MASNSELVDLLESVSTRYVFGGTRYDVYDTDCSGVVCGAFYRVFGLDPYELGSWTGAQWLYSTTAKLWWGTSPDLPYEDMQRGDLIFTSNCSANFSTGNGSHVGFYTGDPNAPFISHFADGCPCVTAVDGVYGNECYFGVKRYLPGSEDDMQPVDVWAYKNESVNGDDDAYKLLTDIRDAVTGAGISSWGYRNEEVGDECDMHQMMVDLRSDVDKLKIASGEIDYDDLAEAVADKLAERMRD